MLASTLSARKARPFSNNYTTAKTVVTSNENTEEAPATSIKGLASQEKDYRH
jgi:hypothetical protein